jgi:tetratricopeptide (TPR) repeat protein
MKKLFIRARCAGTSARRGTDVAFDVDLLTKGRWQDAVELPALGGELLEGLQFPDSPAYEVWLLGERRRLAAATETLLQEAALSAMSTGNLADAVRWANRLVCLSPWVDSHQELLIRAYAISGDHVAARRQLEAAVRLFRRELSCDPAPAVFLAAETSPVKASGPASPTRVHAFAHTGRAHLHAGDLQAARTQLEDALQIARARAWAGVTAAPLALLGHVAVAEGNLDAAWELLEQAVAAGDEASALSHLADAITRSRPQRGGHLWSHVWALTQAVPLARRAADPGPSPGTTKR